MNYSDSRELLQLRPYFSIKHHVNGRIRIVFSAGLLEKVPRAETGQLRELMNGIQGVREVRLNLPARSVVVHYDPTRIPPRVLADLIEGDERAAVQALQTLTTPSASSNSRSKQG
nr:cation transporter [Gammaproteobacteria bacterium]